MEGSSDPGVVAAGVGMWEYDESAMEAASSLVAVVVVLGGTGRQVRGGWRVRPGA